MNGYRLLALVTAISIFGLKSFPLIIGSPLSEITPLQVAKNVCFGQIFERLFAYSGAGSHDKME